MRFGNEKAWKQWKIILDHPSGAAIMAFAEQWAELMEDYVDAGVELAEIADSTNRIAQTVILNPFKQQVAIGLLIQCWDKRYSEKLAVWYEDTRDIDGFRRQFD